MPLGRTGLKNPDNVRGQGASRFESGAYTLVREHFKPACNAAIRTLDGNFYPVLKPTLNDNLGVCKEIKNLLAVGFGVAEHRVSCAAEGEETHRGSNTDINADHAR